MSSENVIVALSFDYGMRWIGVAIGQSITKTAAPLTTLRAREGVPNWEQIEALIKEHGANLLVVGLPYTLDGGEQAMSVAARKFADDLQSRYHLPVHLVDERLSSIMAREDIFEKKGYRGLSKQAIDSMAAKLILESWFAQKNS